MKTLFLTIIIWAVSFKALAQDQFKLDSLHIKLKNASNDTVKIDFILQISKLYIAGNLPKAVEFALQAKEIAQKGNKHKFEAKADRALGNLFLTISDYKKASTHYFNALRFYEDTRDTLGLLSMHNNIGAVYDRLQEFDKSLGHYFKSRDLYNHLSTEQQKAFAIGSLYNNIANIYQTKGDAKAARQYYLESLKVARESHSLIVQGIALNNLGKLYLNDLKQPDKALEYLLAGLEVREENQDQSEIAKSLVILGDYYLQQQQWLKGKECTRRAIALGKEVGSLDVLQNAYSCLARIEEGMGNLKESLKAFKLFKRFNDSIRNQFANSEITRLQLQYDFEKAEQLRTTESKHLRNKYLAIIGTLSIGLIVAVLITVVIRLKSRQTELKRKGLAQDVEIKNKELTTNVMYLIRKNELINNVAERLLKVENDVLQENRKPFHDIILDLQRESDNDNWKEFELRFNQVHSEFYSKLRRMYPALSPAEEKLCAFLRLNMSSKEVASITQQSIKSVEVARARLRKKLNLTNTASNLVTHLANF